MKMFTLTLKPYGLTPGACLGALESWVRALAAPARARSTRGSDANLLRARTAFRLS